MAIVDAQLFAELAVMLAIVVFGSIGFFFSSYLATRKAEARQLLQKIAVAEGTTATELDDCGASVVTETVPESPIAELGMESRLADLLTKTNDDIIMDVRRAFRARRAISAAVESTDVLVQAESHRCLEQGFERACSDLSDKCIAADNDMAQEQTQVLMQSRLSDLVGKSDDDMIAGIRQSFRTHRHHSNVATSLLEPVAQRLSEIGSEPACAKETLAQTASRNLSEAHHENSETGLLMERQLADLTSKTDDELIDATINALRVRVPHAFAPESLMESRLTDLMAKTDDDVIFDMRRAFHSRRRSHACAPESVMDGRLTNLMAKTDDDMIFDLQQSFRTRRATSSRLLGA